MDTANMTDEQLAEMASAIREEQTKRVMQAPSYADMCSLPNSSRELPRIRFITPEKSCPWCPADARTKYIKTVADADGRNTATQVFYCFLHRGYFDSDGNDVNPAEL